MAFRTALSFIIVSIIFCLSFSILFFFIAIKPTKLDGFLHHFVLFRCQSFFIREASNFDFRLIGDVMRFSQKRRSQLFAAVICCKTTDSARSFMS